MVKALGIEAISNDAVLDIEHDLPRDQTLAVGGKQSLATDQQPVVDPFPGARLEMSAQPVSVDQVEHKPSLLAQRQPRLLKEQRVLFRALEIAKGVAENDHTIE